MARTGGKGAEVKQALLGSSCYGFLFLVVMYKRGGSYLWSPSPTALKKILWKKTWSKDAHMGIPLAYIGAGGQQGMKDTGCFLSDRFLAFDKNAIKHVNGVCVRVCMLLFFSSLVQGAQ